MRFFNLVAILLALGRVSAEVSDAVAPNLRGSEPEVNEDRDLAVYAGGSSSSYSKSASFSFNCCYKGSNCLDMYAHCMAYALTDADTKAVGNSLAEAEFYAYACCGAIADAHACSLGCVKAKGKIDLDVTADSTNGKSFNLKMKLTEATMTVAKASSEAQADAYASAGGSVYTETDASYCANKGKGTPQCSPGATSALASASASSFGDAFAVADADASASAASGTSSKIATWVNAKGQSVKQVSAYVTTVAKSWSFAAASTMASAYVSVLADASAIAKHCEKGYDLYCSTGECPTWTDKTAACNAAKAFGSGYGRGYAESCASASAAAHASTKVVMTFGGSITSFDNNGNSMVINLPSGTSSATGSAATICSRD